MLATDNNKNVGTKLDMHVISIIFDITDPIPIPSSEEVVNYETDLAEISPMLFYFAKWKLI